METSVRGHSLYFSAAKLAIEVCLSVLFDIELLVIESVSQIYISLHDKPSKSQQENGEKDDESEWSSLGLFICSCSILPLCRWTVY